MKLCGIYRIRNNVNGKIYIGSSYDILGRIKQHGSSLNRGNHHSLKLQRAWNKYGSDAFSFDILELCERDELVSKEFKHIKDNMSHLFGYNMTYKTQGGRTAKVFKNWQRISTGEVFYCSATYLMNLFPEEKLSSRALSELGIGKLRYQYKGWRCLDADVKVKPKNQGKRIVRHWENANLGVQEHLSCQELIEKYPDQKLVKGSLNALAWGRKPVYKGWVCLDPQEANVNNPKIRLWEHPTLGRFEGLITDLIAFDTSQKLPHSSLSKVARGLKDSYGGWTCLGELDKQAKI